MKAKVSNLADKSVSILCAAKMIVLQACDVGSTLEDMSVMAAKGKSSMSATYCAAGNPSMTNCVNQTGVPGISMHYFPKDEIYGRSGFGLSKFTGKTSSLRNSQLCVLLISTEVVSILWAFWFMPRMED